MGFRTSGHRKRGRSNGEVVLAVWLYGGVLPLTDKRVISLIMENKESFVRSLVVDPFPILLPHFETHYLLFNRIFLLR